MILCPCRLCRIEVPGKSSQPSHDLEQHRWTVYAKVLRLNDIQWCCARPAMPQSSRQIYASGHGSTSPSASPVSLARSHHPSPFVAIRCIDTSDGGGSSSRYWHVLPVRSYFVPQLSFGWNRICTHRHLLLREPSFSLSVARCSDGSSIQTLTVLRSRIVSSLRFELMP